MKKILMVTLLFAIGNGLKAQTNTIPLSGSVGIGTTTPTATLTVNSGNASSVSYTGTPVIGDLIGAYDRARLSIGNTANGSSAILFYGKSNTSATLENKWELGTSLRGNENSFYLFNVLTGNASLYVSNNGNLGIGSSTPQERLDVAGNPVFGTETERLSMHSRGLGFNRQVATGIIYDNTRSAYQFTHSAATDPSIDNLSLQVFGANGISTSGYAFSVNGLGQVGINTQHIPTGYQFAVNGNVIATSMTVKLYTDWPDYVFKKGYKLLALTKIANYIDKNHRLPDMPSEKDVAEKGVNLGEVNKLLTRKIEELTLYLIEQQKQMKMLEKRLKKIENKSR